MQEEEIEIYSEDGLPTGALCPRSKIHANGLWHKTAQIWVVDQRARVLIQKRHPKKEGSPSKWDVSCGGHCTNGETSITGGLRELEEELGFRLAEKDLTLLGSTKYISQEGRNKEFIDIYMCAHRYDVSKIQYQREEISEIRSLPVSELQKEISKDHTFFANRPEALRLLFNEMLFKRP